MNNPIKLIDPDGMSARNDDGSVTLQGYAGVDENGNISGTTQGKVGKTTVTTTYESGYFTTKEYDVDTYDPTNILINHTVGKGETVSSIAKNYGVEKKHINKQQVKKGDIVQIFDVKKISALKNDLDNTEVQLKKGTFKLFDTKYGLWMQYALNEVTEFGWYGDRYALSAIRNDFMPLWISSALSWDSNSKELVSTIGLFHSADLVTRCEMFSKLQITYRSGVNSTAPYAYISLFEQFIQQSPKFGELYKSRNIKK